MTEQDIIDFANDLIEKHLDPVWKFKWTNKKTAWGTCDEADWSIGLSRPLFHLLKNKEDAKKTIVHEIAHAAVGCVEGHNAEWKAKARELGLINPKSTSRYEKIEDDSFYKYVIVLCDKEKEVIESTDFKKYLRKPRKSLRGCFDRRNKERSMGRLYYMPQATWNSFISGEIDFNKAHKEAWQ